MPAARALEVPLPERQQQIVGLAYSRDGTQLWVRRTHMDPAPVYDVFVGEVFRCSVRLEQAGAEAEAFYKSPVIVGGRVYQLFLDRETDVPSIAAFDVPASCRNGASTPEPRP